MMLIGWLVSLQKRRERRGEHDVIREDLIPATVEMNMFKLIFLLLTYFNQVLEEKK